MRCQILSDFEWYRQVRTVEFTPVTTRELRIVARSANGFAGIRETIRREMETEVLPETDIAVCGGGTAGVVAALAAAEEIIIYDEHYYGRNIDLGLLPENVTVICGKPPCRKDWAGGLDNSFAGLILLGFHSRNNTGGLLHHSYEPDIRDLILNGVPVGEIGMETAIAGDRDVPLVMITADSAGVKEAGTLVPGVVGVSVKESLSATGGACLPAKLTARLIREAARGIVENPPPAKPWKITGPELRVIFNSGPYRDCFRALFGGGDSMVIPGETVTECWAKYWRMKLQVREAMG